MSQQINLFNPIFLKQKKYFSAVTMLQALGLIIAGSAVLCAYASYRLTDLEKEAKSTAAQRTALQKKMDKVNAAYSPRQKSKALEEEIRKTQAELKSLQTVAGMLQKGDLGDTSGYAEYMRAFSRQIVDGVWLTGFSIEGAGNEIAIQGRALKPELVPAYITRLKHEAVLQGRSFAALEMQGANGVQPTKGEPAAAGQKPAYIDFSLQSSGMLKERQQAKAVKADPLEDANAYLETMRALNAARDAAGISGAKNK